MAGGMEADLNFPKHETLTVGMGSDLLVTKSLLE
jgi:hypothetical protein